MENLSKCEAPISFFPPELLAANPPLSGILLSELFYLGASVQWIEGIDQDSNLSLLPTPTLFLFV